MTDLMERVPHAEEVTDLMEGCLMRSRVVGGSCLGGVLGGLLAVVAGVLIANTSYQNKLETSPKVLFGEVFDPFVHVIVMAIGAGIGGIIGAIAGAAVGAGVAARWASPSAPAGARPGVPSPAVPPAPMSAETELAQLKERIAELEQKKHQQEGRFQREGPEGA